MLNICVWTRTTVNKFVIISLLHSKEKLESVVQGYT